MTLAPWRQSTVADEFDVQLGKRLDAAVNRGALKVCINNRGVRWGRIEVNEAISAPLTEADIRDLRLVAGDVLMCEGGEIGRSAVWNEELVEAYFLNTLHRLRSKGGYNPLLLVAFFEQWDRIGKLSAVVGKATLAHLTKENLLRVQLPSPTRDEQDRIVDVLTTIDQLIATLERVIAKKHAIKLGMMQQLIAGKIRLPGFTGPWERVTVEGVAAVKTGPFGSSLHERDYVAQGTPIITVEHLTQRGNIRGDPPMVSESDRRRLRAYCLESGDIVFSRVGSIDRNAMVTDREAGWLFSGRLLRVRFNGLRADPAFMSAQFHSRKFVEAVRSVAVGQTMPSLNTSILKGIPIALPPLKEQEAIGAISLSANDELGRIEDRLAKARAIKQGMMQQLLTGRVRLPVEIAP